MACKTCKNLKVSDPAAVNPPAGSVAPSVEHYPEIRQSPSTPGLVERRQTHAPLPPPLRTVMQPMPTPLPVAYSTPAPVIQVTPSHHPAPAPMVFKDASCDSVRIVDADERNVARQALVIGSKDAPKSYGEILIPPSAAPDVQTLRNPDFRYTLVEIEAAGVIKGFCAAPVEPDSVPCPDCSPEIPAPICLNPCAEKSCESQGHELGHCWTDARPVHEMLLLGRVGRCLARLLGEGVLWLGCNGMVKAIKDVPLRVSHLWHQWLKPTPSSAPIIGQPMPFPYQVIADIDGHPYVIQGLSGEDSITVWDHEEQQFFQKPVTDFPVCVRHKLGFSPAIELVGFDPLSPFGDPSDLRCLKRLEGEGMIWFRRIPTAPDVFCDCGTCDPLAQVQDYTTVAEFIPNPPSECSPPDCPSILAFTTNGPRWVQASEIECLRGAPGTPGADGANGQDGEPVTVATYNACTNCPPSNE